MLEGVDIGRRDGEHWLLRHVRVRVSPGDRVALVGPTGSGKTLLLRALAMLDRLDEGTIRWNGKDVHGDAVPLFRSRCVYLHQQPALLEGTVEENWRAVYQLAVHRRHQYDRTRMLKRLDLLGRDASFLTKRLNTLSGGEQQMTALLRAIQIDPQVLLLDEPTSALDPQAAHDVELLVERWFQEAAAERALVWVTHDAGQAQRVADRFLQMRRGQLVEETDAKLR